MTDRGPGQPVHLLVDIADVLSELGIPYALVGAFAVSFYGTPRSTNDVDAILWLQQSRKTSTDLEGVLANLNYRTKTRMGDPDDPISGVIAVEDNFGNRLDLLLGIRGMQPQASTRTKSATFFGRVINIIGMEDLVAMKVFAGGVQDLEDVRGILAISGAQLNLSLLNNIAADYGQNIAQKLNAILKDALP